MKIKFDFVFRILLLLDIAFLVIANHSKLKHKLYLKSKIVLPVKPVTSSDLNNSSQRNNEIIEFERSNNQISSNENSLFFESNDDSEIISNDNVGTTSGTSGNIEVNGENLNEKNEINLPTTNTINSVNKMNSNKDDKENIFSKFKRWHQKYNKEYSLTSDEAKKRFGIFKENYKFINSQNSQNSFIMGLGPFADLNYKEFRSKILKKKPNGEIGKLIEEIIKKDFKMKNISHD